MDARMVGPPVCCPPVCCSLHTVRDPTPSARPFICMTMSEIGIQPPMLSINTTRAAGGEASSPESSPSPRCSEVRSHHRTTPERARLTHHLHASPPRVSHVPGASVGNPVERPVGCAGCTGCTTGGRGSGPSTREGHRAVYEHDPLPTTSLRDSRQQQGGWSTYEDAPPAAQRDRDPAALPPQVRVRHGACRTNPTEVADCLSATDDTTLPAEQVRKESPRKVQRTGGLLVCDAADPPEARGPFVATLTLLPNIIRTVSTATARRFHLLQRRPAPAAIQFNGDFIRVP
jgi:hypothetical protein